MKTTTHHSPGQRAARAVLAGALTLAIFSAAQPAPVICPNPGLDCRRTLVIPVKYVAPHCPDPAGPCVNYLSIFRDPPSLTAAQLAGLLAQRVNPNFDAWSFGDWQFQFEVLVNPDSVDGWWPMPASFQDYLVSLSSGASFWKKGAAQRAIAEDAVGIAAQASINGLIPSLAEYSRLVIIDNQHGRYGQSNAQVYVVPVPDQHGSILAPHLFTGTLCGIGEDEDALESILGHELMHQLGADDFYGSCLIDETPLAPFVSECNGAWDVMADDGAGPNHPTAYNKLFTAWLPSDAQRVVTLPLLTAPFSTSLEIHPIEALDTTHARLARIPFALQLPGTPFEGYHLECRRAINGDHLIPEEGVLIQIVREAAPGVAQNGPMPARVIHADPPFVDVGQAALQPGESWADAARGIIVSFDGYAGPAADGACQVTVQYAGSPLEPDPAFKTVDGISSDLWMDSVLNGWGIYPPSQPVDADGAPAGQGDPFWVAGKNSLHYRVRNLGDADTPKLSVRLVAEQPPYASCGTGSPAKILDEIVFVDPMPPGSTSTGQVGLYVPDDEMIRVRAEILAVPGETTTANNKGERIFHTGSDSSVLTTDGPSEVILSTVVANGCPVNLLFTGVPKYLPELPEPNPDPTLHRWRSPDPGLFLLPPGESVPLLMTFAPPNPITPGQGVSIPLSFHAGGGLASQGGLYPDDLMEIAAFTVTIPVVEPSALTASVPAGPHRPMDPIQATGALTPATAGAALGLVFVTPSLQEVVVPVTTDSRGSWSLGFEPAEEGIWSLQALWQGDETRAEARSAVARFLVVPDRACALDAECDDANPCTLEGCDRMAGRCLYSMNPDGTACDDGDLCTAGGVCQAGACGQPVLCDDASVCTADSCEPAMGTCRFDPLPLDEVATVELPAADRLVWSPTTGASHWNSYRGTIPADMLGSRRTIWDETCLESGDAQGDGILTTFDVAEPPAGTAFYYVVTERSLCGEGPAGMTPSGAPRHPPSPC